jgi:hypothetical protein
LYINYSETVVIGLESTNAKIGVKVENTTTTNLRLPIFSAISLVGPGTGVAGSVGILADNANDPANPASFGIASSVKVSGFQTGIRTNQTTTVSEPNTALIDRPLLSGNGTAISVGTNSILQGNSNTTDPIVTTGNGIIQPGFPESFFAYDAPGSLAGPFADALKTGNVTLNNTSTFDARLTSKTGATTTVFSFDEEVGALPFGLIPPTPDAGGTYDPYGSSFEPGQVSQTGGQFRIENGALNGPLNIAFATLNHPDPNEAGRYILDPVDISKYQSVNIVAKLGNANQAKGFIFGLSDTDGDLALFTVSTEGMSSSTYSTITINLAAPGIPLSLGDSGQFDLSKIMGFAVLGDEGLLNGATNVPFNIIFDQITASSLVDASSLSVTGAVNLAGAKLNVSPADGYTPTLNQTFTIIDNDGADAVSGTFAGVANGGTATIGTLKYQVNYNAGTGNDVVLTYKGTVGTVVNSTIVDRHIFYNQSVWDGNSAAINATNDNAAIAPGKTPYLPGAGVAVAANITSFTRGINGIMVDLSAGVNHTGITASDFTFKVGNNNAPNTWATAPAPAIVSVIPGGGVGGSDRVEITWTQGQIKNQWLEVQVLATANTGLVAADVHFWGNRGGDSGSSSGPGTFETNSTDASQVFLNIGTGKPITDLRDYNRDGAVNSTDASLVFSNIGTIVRLNLGAGGPFAPEADPAADDGNSGVAQALTAQANPSGLPKLPGWIASRLSSVNLNSGPIAKLFTQLAESNSPRADAVLAKVNEVTDALGLDDSLLESLIDGRA